MSGCSTARTPSTFSRRSSRPSEERSPRRRRRRERSRDGRQDRRSHGERAGAVPGRAVLAGDHGQRPGLRGGSARPPAGGERDGGRGDHRADRADLRQPRGDPPGGRLGARPDRQDDGLSHRPRRLPRDERGLREADRRPSARPVDGRDRPAPVRRQGRDRGHSTRLGGLEPVARDPEVETVVFDHHAGDLPDWVKPENAVISQDGALTTTLVGVLAEREIAVTPLEATAFALGIHEDTGSLTYPSATQRDAEALAWCLRHGARQELLASFLHTPLSDDERELLTALLERLEPHDVDGVEVLVTALAWPTYVDGISN